MSLSIEELTSEVVKAEIRINAVEFVQDNDKDELPNIQAQIESLTTARAVLQRHDILVNKCSDGLCQRVLRLCKTAKRSSKDYLP